VIERSSHAVNKLSTLYEEEFMHHQYPKPYKTLSMSRIPRLAECMLSFVTLIGWFGRVTEVTLSLGMIYVASGDLLNQEVEVIANSIGGNVKGGFGGMIGRCIVKACGEDIITEAHNQAVANFGTGDVPVGKFVSTSAGNSGKHKFILHCVCPNFSDANSEKILTQLIQDVFQFCHDNNVESISVPPMSSGVLGFPTENCAKCFFKGIMNFLEAVNMTTCMKKMYIVVYEEDKAKVSIYFPPVFSLIVVFFKWRSLDQLILNI
jgi:O-acetyl-ADP-ribose deacetylase (regulator of RNase III)